MGMHYLNQKAVRQVARDHNKWLSKDALHAIDVKVGNFLEKVMTQFNGHHARITSEVVNLIKI